MADLPGIPVRMTLFETGVLVEVDPNGTTKAFGGTTFVPLTYPQLEALRDACPDDAVEEWKAEP